MIFRLWLLISLVIWQPLAQAQDDYLAIAREAERLAPLQIAKYRSDVLQVSQKSRETSQLQTMTLINNKINVRPTKSNEDKKPYSNVMIFVSFSMPKASLIAYLREANAAHASVVIRGLVNNSFKDTFKAVTALVKEANGGGVELNPIAFDQFHIKRVPTVVVTSNDDCISKSSCQLERDYDVISGNIGLEGALKQIRDHGKVSSDEAGVALARLMGGAHA